MLAPECDRILKLSTTIVHEPCALTPVESSTNEVGPRQREQLVFPGTETTHGTEPAPRLRSGRKARREFQLRTVGAGDLASVDWRMDAKLFATVFGSVFLAELGDKTQLATLLFASESDNPKLTVFLASALALVLTTAIGVIAGAALGRLVSPRTLSIVAGVGFIAIGLWTLSRAWSGA